MKSDDTILGKALTREMKAAGSACPPLEDIAALVDGAVSAADRDTLMGHFASCGRCREIFIMSRSLASEQVAEAAAPADTRRFRFLIPSSLAAAAVLIVAISLTMKQPPTGTVQVVAKNEQAVSAPAVAPPGKSAEVASAVTVPAIKDAVLPASAEGMARVLARGSDPAQLAALAHTRDKVLGFAGQSDHGALAFRIGMNALDLEIALLADDSERAQARAARIGSLLQTLVGDQGGAEMEALGEKLEKGEKPVGFAGRSAGIEALIPRDQVLYAKLGAWAEGARLAAKSGNSRFFAGGLPADLRRIETSALPQGAAAALKEVRGRIKDSRKIDYSSVEKDLEELIRAF